MNGILQSPIATCLLSYLLNALWQAPLVWIAAWIAVRVLAGRGPRAEHRVWVCALGAEIALPGYGLRLASPLDAFVERIAGMWRHGGSVSDAHVQVLAGPGVVHGHDIVLASPLSAILLAAFGCWCFYAVARLAWGLWQTWRLGRDATPVSLTGDLAQQWAERRREFGVEPALCVAAVEGPVSVGMRHGRVLFPPDFLEHITADDLDAVLAHELAHFSRNDFLKNLLYGLLSIPVAWHPSVRRTLRRIAESREQVCDAIAADALQSRKGYAKSLLRLAGLMARTHSSPIHAIGILDGVANPGVLERRIMTLTRKEFPLTVSRRVLTVAACAVLAVATGASALALHTDVAVLSAAPEQADVQGTIPKTLSVKPSIMAGQKIGGNNPEYPAEARAKKIQGKVVLDATISKDGTIAHLRVKSSPSELLSRSSIDAVRTWRYKPYLLNGEAVEVETEVTVTFNLGK